MLIKKNEKIHDQKLKQKKGKENANVNISGSG